MAREVHPATLDRWDDVASLLGPSDPDAPACWCLYFRLGSSDFSKLRGPERPRRLRGLMAEEDAPGLLAYEDGIAVGWCAFGPRTAMERLQRSRTIPRVDDVPVWSVVCFVVRPGYRRRGVAGTLLAGAIEYATSRAVAALEAYPADTGTERISTAFAYTGTVAMFQRAGFTKVADTTARTGGKPRIVMRRTLR